MVDLKNNVGPYISFDVLTATISSRDDIDIFTIENRTIRTPTPRRTAAHPAPVATRPR
jgi:hypothetical protein